MSYRAGVKHAWPPVLTWDQPAAWDENGVACYATEAWLRAKYGPPPLRTYEPATDDDAEIDEILALAGFERVTD